MPIHEDMHVSVFIKGPDQTTTLIRINRPTGNLERPRPVRLWKFPGGKTNRMNKFLHQSRNEYPEETAVREVQQETGIVLKKKDLFFLHEEDMGHYSKLYYGASVNSWKGLHKEMSLEYEQPRIFPISTLFWLSPFHERYKRCFLEHIHPRLHEF